GGPRHGVGQPAIVSRKVGTPQSRVLARARSGRPDGQCNREQTADGPACRPQVRVKRCGKSAPACEAIRTARSTPLGARPSRRCGRLVRSWRQGQPSGRSHQRDGHRRLTASQNPAYRPTHRHRQLRRREVRSARKPAPSRPAARIVNGWVELRPVAGSVRNDDDDELTPDASTCGAIGSSSSG
ncbi:MAG: Uncharacterized protein FD127_4330, partial [Acidimicrobiaceae bacterium]